ncbi:ATP-dependent zinc metalloprotease FtsH [Candidatus Kaiserbacteria bacterium]|nr:ATP-dependent zinc metalloprotease FtsH [Candidatus Kaiserbacteria bacterium]
MEKLKKFLRKVKARVLSLKNMKIRTRRRIWVTAIAAATAYLLVHFYWPEALPNIRSIEVPLISYTEFFDHVEKGEVQDVVIRPDVMVGRLKSGTVIATRINSTLATPVYDLRKYNVVISFGPTPADADQQGKANYAGLLCIFIGLIWAYFFFWGIGPQGEIFLKFWQSRANRYSEKEKGRITFADVAGVDEAKTELEEVVAFLKNPQEFQELGGKIPKGVLLMGPPGTGKTLLARATAGEAGVPFHSMSGSDFVEMWVGMGAKRVRGLFDRARSQMPCIVYIDEIDSLGTKRSATISSGGDREYQQTTNALLTELDGFDKYPGVVFMASTNNPGNLDEALLRRGRLDIHIVVPLPDAKGREAILKVHTRKMPLATDVDLVMIALGTPGFSGADLAHIANEAALTASREKPPSKKIAMRHFMLAKDRLLMGVERKSLIVTDADKLRTAYHEVGHAFVALRTQGSDPVEKVSVMPRGNSLGVTIQLPPADRHHYTKSFLTARLAVMMGGRAAEEAFYPSDVSAGAEMDIAMATTLASSMVCQWGMSETLGLIALKKSAGGIYVNRESGGMYNCSPDLAARADDEIRVLLATALNTARSIIENERGLVEKISRELFLKTELSGVEIQKIIEAHSASLTDSL